MAISPAEKAESIADCWEKQFELNNMSDDISDNYQSIAGKGLEPFSTKVLLMSLIQKEFISIPVNPLKILPSDLENVLFAFFGNPTSARLTNQDERTVSSAQRKMMATQSERQRHRVH
ncbi:hypothetical protein CEXT_2241 [Caerostris extrusa]|uniref:Uncharacterized protein n=1 Tax=Caerostris extrusa TaxID=172846 RepID=A0AAV4MKJ3_CAEEX|nr:hypothetical protein CEXT_2241 [Caerostris extrusa]